MRIETSLFLGKGKDNMINLEQEVTHLTSTIAETYGKSLAGQKPNEPIDETMTKKPVPPVSRPAHHEVSFQFSLYNSFFMSALVNRS